MHQTARVRTASLALACSLALALSGCGGGEKKSEPDTSVPPSAPSTAMVQGTLQFSGGPAGTKPRPVAGTVLFRGPGGSTTKAEVDSSGKFAIGLYPGTYTIEGTSPQYDGGKGRCTTDPATTKLTAGKTVTANVYCQVR